jgi:hypothetical protein
LRIAFSLNAAKPKNNPWEGIGKEVGRETRPAATGTVALPNTCILARESTQNVEEPDLGVASWLDFGLAATPSFSDTHFVYADDRAV